MPPREMTWGDLDKFVREQKLDQDEYFLLGSTTNHEAAIWGPDTRNIAVWLAPGQNEGYYLHVEEVVKYKERQPVHVGRAGGKYWSVESGMVALQKITAFVYGWKVPNIGPGPEGA